MEFEEHEVTADMLDVGGEGGAIDDGGMDKDSDAGDTAKDAAIK